MYFYWAVLTVLLGSLVQDSIFLPGSIDGFAGQSGAGQYIFTGQSFTLDWTV